MANQKYLLDKSVAEYAPLTGDRAGQVITATGVIDLAEITTAATTDAIACLKLPARHRIIDCEVTSESNGSGMTFSVGVIDEDVEVAETMDYELITATICGQAGGMARMGLASYVTIADVNALLTGYFDEDRLIGIEPENVTDWHTTGKIIVTVSYVAIEGWETLLVGD